MSVRNPLPCFMSSYYPSSAASSATQSLDTDGTDNSSGLGSITDTLNSILDTANRGVTVYNNATGRNTPAPSPTAPTSQQLAANQQKLLLYGGLAVVGLLIAYVVFKK